MASRDYTRHTVSSTAPAIARVGDEYYNPTTNTLYKAIDYNGTTVQWEATPLSINGVDYAIAGNLVVAAGTDSKSTATGALTITNGGGVGVAGNVYVGSRVGYVWTNNNVSSAYTIFNNTAVSIDTVFG